jgi:LPS-assembly lipoprotein
MSSSDTVSPSSPLRRAGLVAALMLFGLSAGACTVQPLYGEGSASPATGSVRQQLASVSVKEVDTRYGQEVRNHLIFGFGGGAGQPASPRYVMDLRVQKTAARTATVQRTTNDNEPTAGAISLVGIYSLVDTTTGQTVARGKRSAVASFDRPSQTFAEDRAERDAENRAARELAAFIQLAVAQDLSRQGS